MTTTRNKVLLGVGVLLFLLSSVVALVYRFELGTWGQVLANLGFVAVGGLIMLRRPDNILGTVVMAVGVVWTVTLAVAAVADHLFVSGDGELATWLAWITSLVIPAAIGLFFLILLLFPNGRVDMKFGRPLMRIALALIVLGTITQFFAKPQLMGTENDFGHPFLGADLAETLTSVAFVSLFALVFTELVAAVILIIRMRRSDPVVRRQIAWFVYAFALYVLISFINVVFTPFGTTGGFNFFDAVGFVLIPIAIGIAIMKYRLFDIDVIVNRSITYGLLAIFIGGVYVAIVVGLGALFSDSAAGLSIVATVVVAIAFQPVRRRVQRWANRLVYGERATPYEVLARFSRRSAELSHEELMERIPQLIVDGTGAKESAVWIRADGGFEVASSWPVNTAASRLEGSDSFVDAEADFSLPVFHDGELLGGLSLVKEQGEAISPNDEELLRDLAGAMGLALRNAALTTELRKQVAELEASRERVLAAADQARRDLERDLDSGPQQRLVALKVKLGPTRKLAERAGAEKTAKVLGQLEEQAGAAIQAVRDFAGGVYPPLLEAEGLAVAITQQTQKAAIPVSVHGENLDRYPRDAEAAVYFSVLEALQNTAKYANATSASVSLVDTGSELLFEVRDDGDGFDPSVVERGAGLDGMADRLDTVGGRIAIDSTPGEGTTVSGSIPLKELAEV